MYTIEIDISSINIDSLNLIPDPLVLDLIMCECCGLRFVNCIDWTFIDDKNQVNRKKSQVWRD